MAQQQEGDFRNNKFTFGYLNTAQDPTDIEGHNLARLEGVDLDALALGTIKSSNYNTSGSGSPDWTMATIIGDEFRLDPSPGDIQYKEGLTWGDIDNYLTAPNSPSVVLEESKGGIEFDDGNPEWSGFDKYNDFTVDGDTITFPTIDNKVMIDPSRYDQTNTSYTIKIRIKSGGTTYERWILDADATWTGTYTIAGVSGGILGYQNIGFSIYVTMDQAETFTAGDEFVFTVANDVLEDGEYHYLVSQVHKYNGAEIESKYSDVTPVKLLNENYLGQQVKWLHSIITIPRHATDNRWLYRKGPRDDDWFRIAIVLNQADAGTSDDAELLDNITLGSIIDSKVIQNLNPDSLQDLLDSVGATSWSHIFEKDNRLWAVPNERKDVIFFAEPLEWWRWSRNNSLGFRGDFVGVAHLRDEKNVSIKTTAAFVTTQGLYNVYGSGVEDDPYVRIPHEQEFGSVADSLVKANNTLYMMSNGATYEDGQWGRKLYSYDLSRLTELSGIVQGSNPFVDNSKTVTYINQIGGNKLKILMSDGSMMMYHIGGDGFGESSLTLETAGEWIVQTRTESALNSWASKFNNSDMLRLDFSGRLVITYIIDGEEQAPIDITHTSRDIAEVGACPFFGKRFAVRFEGYSNCEFHSIEFVKES